VTAEMPKGGAQEPEPAESGAGKPDVAPEPPSQSAESPPPADEAARREAMPLEAVPTQELLVWMLGVLGAKAWQGMGLVPNPGSGKIERNLADAKTAIDAFSALFEAIRQQIDPSARRDLESLLTTLRLNFVEKSSNP
jgi:hypothetical protein